MSERIPKYLLMDMIGCIDNIHNYCLDYDFNRFDADSKTVDAVIRNIEVMGESVKRLPEYFINDHPEIPWNFIIGTRNRLIHGYDSVDSKILWDILKNNLPELKIRLESLRDIL